MITRFQEMVPTLDSYWRSIILIGRNVASYKFALAKSLYELAENETTFISLEDLAKPFAKNLCEHLKIQDKGFLQVVNFLTPAGGIIIRRLLTRS